MFSLDLCLQDDNHRTGRRLPGGLAGRRGPERGWWGLGACRGCGGSWECYAQFFSRLCAPGCQQGLKQCPRPFFQRFYAISSHLGKIRKFRFSDPSSHRLPLPTRGHGPARGASRGPAECNCGHSARKTCSRPLSRWFYCNTWCVDNPDSKRLGHSKRIWWNTKVKLAFKTVPTDGIPPMLNYQISIRIMFINFHKRCRLFRDLAHVLMFGNVRKKCFL